MAQMDDQAWAKLKAAQFSGSNDTAYDPLEFYTRSTNKHDHSKNIQVGFPDTIYAEIHRIVNQGNWPKLNSAQAVVRNFVVHGLHALAEREANFEAMEVLNTFRVLAKQEEWSQYRKDCRLMLTNLKEMLDETFADKDWDEAERLCDQHLADLGDLPRRFQDELEDMVTRARAKVESERGKGW